MSCSKLNETYKGKYNFKENKREGKGILIENGKEYFVEFISHLNATSKKRTFEGIRLMIIGNKFYFSIFLFFLFTVLFYKGCWKDYFEKEVNGNI